MGVIGDLSVARALPSGGSCGSMIFFAGGCNFFTFEPYSNLDIYDTLTQQWFVLQLSIPRFSIATVSNENRILFAGGCLANFTCYDLVEIYDIQNGWEQPQYLSQARAAMAYAVVGDLAIFAGGVLPGFSMTDQVDIYNFTTNTWSTATLSEARGWASATAVDNKVLIAGGWTNSNNPSDRVDIYNATTGIWTTASLFAPRCSNGNAATVNGRAYFAGGGNFSSGAFYSPSNVVDIYDDPSSSWLINALSEPLTGHSVVGIGDFLVVAGGENADGNLVSNVEIFYDPQTGITTQPKEDESITIYPNPGSNNLTISAPNGVIVDDVVIYHQSGQKVLQWKPVNNTLDISQLQHGMYIINLVTDQGEIREKLIVK
jgi:hypothetical protein